MTRTFAAISVGLALLVTVALVMLVRAQGRITDLEYRMDELNCVHYVYEDGSAVHIDAEVAYDCLRRKLGDGWNETVLP